MPGKHSASAKTRWATELLFSGCLRELVHTRESINRVTVDVKPGNPFLSWLHRADPTSQDLTLADSQREPKVYLVPEYVDEREVLISVARKVIQIFEEHLD